MAKLVERHYTDKNNFLRTDVIQDDILQEEIKQQKQAKRKGVLKVLAAAATGFGLAFGFMKTDDGASQASAHREKEGPKVTYVQKSEKKTLTKNLFYAQQRQAVLEDAAKRIDSYKKLRTFHSYDREAESEDLATSLKEVEAQFGNNLADVYGTPDNPLEACRPASLLIIENKQICKGLASFPKLKKAYKERNWENAATESIRWARLLFFESKNKKVDICSYELAGSFRRGHTQLPFNERHDLLSDLGLLALIGAGLGAASVAIDRAEKKNAPKRRAKEEKKYEEFVKKEQAKLDHLRRKNPSRFC